MIELRPYQRQCIDAIYAYFQENAGNCLAVLPTASGKAVIAAHFLKEVLQTWPDQRIIVVVHTRELVAQNATTLFSIWPEAPAGVYSAGLGRRDLGDAICFASIQSVFRRSADLGAYDLILIDEAHLLPPTADGMYRLFLTEQRILNPAVKVIGLTATPFRMGQGMLHEGERAFFDEIAYEATIPQLLAERYLSPLTTAPVHERLRVVGIGTRQGEFLADELQEAVDREAITRAACAEIVALGNDRKAWLVFCAGVRHAKHVRDELARLGVSVATVTGEMPTPERDRIIEAFRRGELRALTSMNVLTTGFDVPHVDLLALLRPTKSPGLYVQCMGRGMRVAPGKADCCVLDFAGNIARHGPVDSVRPPRPPGQRGGEAPFKKCPVCKAKMHPTAAYCGDCGYEFPSPAETPKHDAVASTKAAMRDQASIVEYDALQVSYSRHCKVGSPDSLRVDYLCGLRRVASEWVCLEHEGYARTKARLWWRQRAYGWRATLNDEPPTTIGNALVRLDELRTPSAILVDESDRFPRIISVRFDETRRSYA